MSKYLYKAKTGQQELVSGTIEAESLQNAVRRISELGLIAVDVDEQSDKPKSHFYPSLHFNLPTPKRISVSEKATFIIQLYELLDSGVPLLRALQLIHEKVRNPALKKITQEIAQSVEDGSSLSDAIEKYPSVFPNYFVSVIHSGEMSGNLNIVLKRLVDLLESEMDRNASIQATLIYPISVLVVGALTVFILVTFVIPPLTDTLENLGRSLPTPTRILISLSDFLSQFWPGILFGLAVTILTIKKAAKLPHNKTKLDELKLKLPVFGSVIRNIELGRLMRTFGTLLGAGVNILQALDACVGTLENSILKMKMMKSVEEIKYGKTLTLGLEKTGIFGDQELTIVAVGEESGKLEKGVNRLANNYEKKSAASIKMAMSLFGPALIVGIAAIIGFVVLSLLLPILDITTNIQ